MLLNRSGKSLVPLLTRIDIKEEYQKYIKFEKKIDALYDYLEEEEDYDSPAEDDLSEDKSSKYLVTLASLHDILNEVESLKAISTMSKVSLDKLLKLLKVLEYNIICGSKRASPANMIYDWDDRDTVQSWFVGAIRAATSSIIALCIMTSYKVPKEAYQEDIINHILKFVKCQLEKVIYCLYDSAYGAEMANTDSMKKNLPVKDVRKVYSMICRIVSLFAELVENHVLTEMSLIDMLSLCVTPFFIEDVCDLHLSALKLATTIFSRYEEHRKSILDDVIVNMKNISTSSRCFSNSYNIKSEQSIKMFSALILLLIESATYQSPTSICTMKENSPSGKTGTDRYDVLFKTMYENSCNVTLYILTGLLCNSDAKCGSSVLDTLLSDIFTLLFSPEWPAAELLLTSLVKILANRIRDKGVDMGTKMTSMELLGSITVRLKRETMKSISIEDAISAIKAKSPVTDVTNKNEQRIKLYQNFLLKYFNSTSQTCIHVPFARHFCLSHWYYGLLEKVKCEEMDGSTLKYEGMFTSSSAISRRKQFFVEHLFFDNGTYCEITSTDIKNLETVCCHLSVNTPLFQNCGIYINQLIAAMGDSSIYIRTKAVKCLTKIIETDPAIMDQSQVQIGVKYSFLDSAVPIREATIDLVGRYLSNNPHMICNYYDLMLSRILDTSVNVRKRVIKTLKDVCLTNPEFTKNKKDEVILKIIRRINDPEESVRKLVTDLFESAWFCQKENIPLKLTANDLLSVMDLIGKDVRDVKSLELLLQSILKPEKDECCKKIDMAVFTAASELIKEILSLLPSVDEINEWDKNDKTVVFLSQQLQTCMTVIHLFVKILPGLLSKHVQKIAPYLSVSCQNQSLYEVVHRVTDMISLVVPVMKKPSKMFLNELVEEFVKLVLTSNSNTIVMSSISSLSSLCKKTNDYTVVKDWFNKYYDILMQHDTDTTGPSVHENKPQLLRALFIFGLLLRHFDFGEIGLHENSGITEGDIFKILYHFTQQPDEDIKYFTLKGIGYACIRHSDFLMDKRLSELYSDILLQYNISIRLKMQVLQNIEICLQENSSTSTINQEKNCSASLKDLGDESTYLSSMIIQHYLKDILQLYIHPDPRIRCSVSKVVHLTIWQGQMHPVQLLPYLICMSTDLDKEVSQMARSVIEEISTKYSLFLYTSYQKGMDLSYKLQKLLQSPDRQDIVRGFTVRENTPESMNTFVYSFVRARKEHRRALVLWILGNVGKPEMNDLSRVLYMCDNVAYFPYKVLDEPLFIIKHIDITVSMHGSTALQDFRNNLVSEQKKTEHSDLKVGNSETSESLLRLIPQDTNLLQEIVLKFHKYHLLALLREHLKQMYSISEEQVFQYSTKASPRTYEKRLSKIKVVSFNPVSTIQLVRNPSSLTPEQLIKEYFDFKALMENFDPSCEDIFDDVQDLLNDSKIEKDPEISSKEKVKPVKKRKALANIKNTLGNEPRRSRPHRSPSKRKKVKKAYKDYYIDSDFSD